MHLTDQEYAGLSAEDFYARVKKNFAEDNKGQRLGQFFMNSLPPVLYEKITCTQADCFYDNSRLALFKNAIFELWEKHRPQLQSQISDCAPAPACVPVARDKDELINEISDCLIQMRISAEDMNDTITVDRIERINDLLIELRNASWAPQG